MGIMIFMHVTPSAVKKFKSLIKAYYRRHGRDLPWRETRDPYHILLSELMLQQTQVERVIPKYHEFLGRFPNLFRLSRSRLSSVLRVWQGLGYNRRALYLKRAAEEIVSRHGGAVPRDPEVLAQLPGIGKATAGAIAAFAFNQPTAFIETNIRRVYLHFFFPRRRAVPDTALLPLIAKTLDRKNSHEWYYALMDYGAMLGAVQKGKKNPNRRSKHYTRQSRFEGSDRQLRGKIIALMLDEKQMSEKILAEKLTASTKRIKKVVASLIVEGFLDKQQKGRLGIASR